MESKGDDAMRRSKRLLVFLASLSETIISSQPSLAADKEIISFSEPSVIMFIAAGVGCLALWRWRK